MLYRILSILNVSLNEDLLARANQKLIGLELNIHVAKNSLNKC